MRQGPRIDSRDNLRGSSRICQSFHMVKLKLCATLRMFVVKFMTSSCKLFPRGQSLYQCFQWARSVYRHYHKAKPHVSCFDHMCKPKYAFSFWAGTRAAGPAGLCPAEVSYDSTAPITATSDHAAEPNLVEILDRSQSDFSPGTLDTLN